MLLIGAPFQVCQLLCVHIISENIRVRVESVWRRVGLLALESSNCKWSCEDVLFSCCKCIKLGLSLADLLLLEEGQFDLGFIIASFAHAIGEVDYVENLLLHQGVACDFFHAEVVLI